MSACTDCVIDSKSSLGAERAGSRTAPSPTIRRWGPLGMMMMRMTMDSMLTRLHLVEDRVLVFLETT
jgi:hypothetical protein